MAVSVKIPTQLREATDGDSTASVEGSTVGEVLDSLYERYGELRSRIAEDGGLRRALRCVGSASGCARRRGAPAPPAAGRMRRGAAAKAGARRPQGDPAGQRAVGVAALRAGRG